jgi:DNA-binding transcriptional regulator WhiA
MVLFVELSCNQRKRFFNEIKQKIDSWEKFYPKYNISRSMFFNYLSGEYNIPLRIFNIWKKISGFQGKINIIEKRLYLKKEIGEISLDEKLAEIIGVLNGDGHISKNKKEICVVGNRNEERYACYLKDLFEKKLIIIFSLFLHDNRFKLKGCSVKLSEFFIKVYGLPQGNKMGKLHIPKKIIINKKLLKYYIRGLFDTDGTIYLRRKNDAVIEISSADDKYLVEIKSALQSLGFSVSLLKNHIAIYKKEEIKYFFQLIKPANSKHLKKYQNYLNLTMRR